MNFNNVRVLGYGHQNRFFGDLFRFATQKNITIEGSLYDLTNQSGVSTPLWTGAEGLIGQDYALTINGIDFGSGRLTALTLPEDQALQEKVYNASFEVSLTGNLFNVTGNYYQGISTSNFNLIDTFSENFGFTQASDGNKSFSHSVNVRVFSGAGDGLVIAKQIASGLRDANNITGLLSGYSNPGRKKYYQETINKISNEYGFTENFFVTKDTGNYSIQLSHSLSLAADGFVDVTENGSIKGLTTDWTNVTNGINHEIEQSYGRCNEMLSAHGPSSLPLNTKIISLGKRLDEFERTADYSVSYSNNLALRTGFSWIYTQNLRKTASIVNVSEQGEIQGWGRLPSEKFAAAKNGYDSIKGGIQGRAQSLYNTAGTLLKVFRLADTNVSYSEFVGSVNYSYDYTNDPNFIVDPYIKRADVVINDSYPLQFFNRYGVVNVGEIVQKMNLRTLGNRSLNMTLIGYRNAPLNGYLTYARNRANQHAPSGETVYLDNCSYVFDSGNRTTTVNIGWSFTRSGEIFPLV